MRRNKKKVKEEKIVDMLPTGSDAAKSEDEIEIEVLKSAMKKHCFI